jgi:integrase
MSKKRLTKLTLEQRPPAADRVEVRDTDSPLVFRITSAGARSLCVRTRLGGDQVRLTYPKAVTVENLADARQWAQQAIEACKAGTDPRVALMTAEEAATAAAERERIQNFANVVDRYVARRVRKEKNNRTADKTERMFALYVTPRWRNRLITDIRRRDVNDLLDDVFDGKIEHDGKTFGGNVTADRVLAQLRALFNWYARQDDEFTSPIVPGMARTSPRDRKRKRILTDEEIVALWEVAPGQGTLGSIAKLLLLTAQRRDEVGLIARAEVKASDAGRGHNYPPELLDLDSVWTIPAERYKTNRPNVVPLLSDARAVIEAQHVLDGCDLVFTTNGTTAFSGYSKSKRRLDDAMLAKLRERAVARGEDPAKVTLPNWRLHDLRRTAKTLMARAGVRPDISERVLGHVIAGVEGVYDQYEYLAEKRDALEQLASLIRRIVTPAANVVAMSVAAE